ncbi:thioredoxin family protein [Deinococcus sp. Marseille-Q6407]|uniref:thioredoxin family protein n=1 Tax=Deinococcus sp. Marseille-Q6407 TaxID=2969223 RepID=UPI0021BFAFAE|nr:thioredoxin family protein [Deinococcus sp. Marseille-Q6407]
MTETATATRFILLTQDHCPNCERLRLMLDKPLKGQFNDQIDVVHREQNTAEFEALTTEYGVQSTPALIDRERGAILRNTGGLGEVKNFLSS